MINYNIKFNEYENNTFNMIETVKKTKIMSIYHCLIKHSTNNSLTISMSKLFERYKNSHKKNWKNAKISLTYFTKLTKQLIDIGLVKLQKTGKINTYFILRVQEKVQEKVQDEKATETIESTSLDTNFQGDNIKALNNNYTNTLYTQPNYGEKAAPVELVSFAKNMMRELRIKSRWVKEKVKEKLAHCTNVNRKGMANYVLKVIIDNKTKQETRREEYRKKVKIGVSSQGQFNQYGQREYTHQDFIDMEYKLLGWV